MGSGLRVATNESSKKVANGNWDSVMAKGACVSINEGP